MNKTMLLVMLASFSASLIGCGEGPQQNSTANQKILRLKCQSPLAFGGNASGDKENDNLEQILVTRYGKNDMPAVVTYLTKIEGTGIINPDQIQKVAITSDLGTEFQDSAHQFVVTKDCETLTANVRGPGIEFAGMAIKSIGMHEIELSLAETSIKMKKEGRTKIKPSKDRRQKGRDMAKQKNLEAQDFANGNIVLNVDIEVKANGATSKVSFQQLSGPMDDTHTVKIATPVMALLTEMTDDPGQIEILQSGVKAPAEAAPVAGKLTPDADATPKETEIEVLALVRFQDAVLAKLPELVAPTDAAAVAPAPASPTEPSTPAVATVVK